MNSIGIVIPCFNSANFLPDALESIARESRGNESNTFTVIVNDGGFDGEKIDSLCMGRFAEVIHLPRNRGIGIARNVGAAFLNTDFFLFLDADDWLHEGAVKALLDAFSLSPRCDFAYGNYSQDNQVVVTPRWNSELIKAQNIASYCNLWRRESFWKLGGYSGIQVAEDWELQTRAMRSGKYGEHIDFTVFEHRQHERNKWQADAARFGGMAGVAKEVANYGIE